MARERPVIEILMVVPMCWTLFGTNNDAATPGLLSLYPEMNALAEQGLKLLHFHYELH